MLKENKYALEQNLYRMEEYPAILSSSVARMRENDEFNARQVATIHEQVTAHRLVLHKRYLVNPDVGSKTSNHSSSSSSSSTSEEAKAAAGEEQDPIVKSKAAIDALIAQSIEAGDANVKMATHCYDTIDLYIRKIDTSLKKYESELRKGQFQLPVGHVNMLDPARKKQRLVEDAGEKQAVEFQMMMREEHIADLRKRAQFVDANGYPTPFLLSSALIFLFFSVRSFPLDFFLISLTGLDLLLLFF